MHVPPSLSQWDKLKDKLDGSAVLGDPTDDLAAWSRGYGLQSDGTGDFTHIKVESIDKKISHVYKYDSANHPGPMKDDEIEGTQCR